MTRLDHLYNQITTTLLHPPNHNGVCDTLSLPHGVVVKRVHDGYRVETDAGRRTVPTALDAAAAAMPLCLPAPKAAIVDPSLKAPYPYFGGKKAIAAEIWERFGDVKNYVEPFFGSGAVLLARPHTPDLELVNDIDGFIVNFWRAVQSDAETVARYADYPAFENDLHARHAWLVARKDSLREQLEGDPDWFDAKIAGWWVWGMSLWIGSGFGSGRGSWVVENGRLVKREGEDTAVAAQLPYVSRPRAEVWDEGAAIVRQSPRLTAMQGVNGAGVARKRLHLMSEKGVKRNRLELAGSPKGVQRKLLEAVSARGGHRAHESGLFAYFDDLQARFRRVRVVCGDWTRVVSPAVLTAKTPTAILLDPPYTGEGREKGLYNTDDTELHAVVRAWAIENGSNPAYRIAYCGYEDGFDWPEGWTCLNWKANGGYANQGDERTENKHREVVWFSPHCIKVRTARQLPLFAAAS